ncbi:zinc-ribbon domain-containing protein [Streptomyces sp. NPDC048473]|uniref:zinc-ribbon domain-containing protein n=1 Tax=unclassified Streptomyces TaxID=2593676 RepID=UPI00371D3225
MNRTLVDYAIRPSPLTLTRSETDAAKSTALRNAGYDVIRVRQRPLQPLHPHDVAVDMTSIHSAVCTILESITDGRLLRSVSPGHVMRYLADYHAAGVVRSEDEARAEVTARRRYDFGNKSFAALHPGLAHNWDAAKNAPLAPHMLTPGSNQKVWFRCPAGHSFDQAVSQTVRRGLGCPYCSNKRAGQGNDLATNYPQLKAQWHPENVIGPHEVTPGSSYRAVWICSRQHLWLAQVRHRIISNSGCPHCYRRSTR